MEYMLIYFQTLFEDFTVPQFLIYNLIKITLPSVRHSVKTLTYLSLIAAGCVCLN